MEFIKLENYSSLIGTVVLLASLMCLLSSYFYDDKGHTTKLFSILIIASLSLFSAHWATYFAAIFIIATAVTELEFLQTLAAIMRKDKNYFDYKKEILSKPDKIKKKLEEAIEEELLTNSNINVNTPIKLSNLSNLNRNESIRLAIDIENKALDYLENEHGKIERSIRLRKDGNIFECDGLISDNRLSKNKIFEIRWIREPEHFQGLMRYAIGGAERLIVKYEEVTGKKPELFLVIIFSPLISLPDERVDKFYKKAKEFGCNLIFHSLKDIGFEIVE